MGLISRVSSRTYRKNKMSFTQNREEIPPFYLEVYYRLDGRHNRPYQFEPKEKALLHNKLELYFWRDSNLKEITDKISETIPFEEAKVPGTKYDFKIVWPDTRSGHYESRPIGRIYYDERSTDAKSEPFNNRRFHTGDLLDVAITPNRNYKPKEKDGKEETMETVEEKGDIQDNTETHKSTEPEVNTVEAQKNEDQP